MANYIGRFAVPDGSGGSHDAWFESLNELAHLRDLMLTVDVATLSSQSVLVGWKLPSGYRFHFPDLIVTSLDGTVTFVDVTRVERLTRPAALAQFGLMAATAHTLGWSFEVRTELPRQRQATQSHVYACRHSLSQDQINPSEAQMPLRTWARSLGRGSAGIAKALALIARRRLFIDWDKPLEPDTPVSGARLGADEHSWKVSFG